MEANISAFSSVENYECEVMNDRKERKYGEEVKGALPSKINYG